MTRDEVMRFWLRWLESATISLNRYSRKRPAALA